MTDQPDGGDAAVIAAWEANAAPWTVAVRGARIESRRLVTDRAVIEAVLARRPRAVLDLGCGEGWLARALAAQGVRVTGIDAVPELIAQARAAGGGEFRVLAYDRLAELAPAPRVDLVVGNFSLLGADSVAAALRAMPNLLHAGGALVIQTLHPLAVCGERPYRDGWRQESWDGLGEGFVRQSPWYFRTLESWLRLLADSGFTLAELREPLHPATGKPASLLLVATAAGR